jgi:hypothetical protein
MARRNLDHSQTEIIRDSDGAVIQRSRNLAGIRRYVGTHPIKILAIDETADSSGKLSILFDDGASFETQFASFDVLRNFVRQWRNVHGAPLLVNGESCDVVSSKNPKLSETESSWRQLGIST